MTVVAFEWRWGDLHLTAHDVWSTSRAYLMVQALDECLPSFELTPSREQEALTKKDGAALCCQGFGRRASGLAG